MIDEIGRWKVAQYLWRAVGVCRWATLEQAAFGDFVLLHLRLRLRLHTARQVESLSFLELGASFMASTFVVTMKGFKQLALLLPSRRYFSFLRDFLRTALRVIASQASRLQEMRGRVSLPVFPLKQALTKHMLLFLLSRRARLRCKNSLHRNPTVVRKVVPR